MQSIHAKLGPLGVNTQGLGRRYADDALGQLTDTLDVYLDGPDPVQSGKSVVYNAFGEVAEERRKWGPTNQETATRKPARVGAFHYNNTGDVTDKDPGDGLTGNPSNLPGQVHRAEKRGKPANS